MSRRKQIAVITGVSGRIGQLLARRLHRRDGVRVIGIDRRAFTRKPADIEELRGLALSLLKAWHMQTDMTQHFGAQAMATPERPRI